MSLRLRLASWYAGLATLSIIGIAVGAYALNGRTQYLDIDRTLSDEAALVAPVLPVFEDEGGVAGGDVPLDVDSSLALYGPTGELLAMEPARATAPPLDALTTLARDDGPAYDWFLRRLPGPQHDPGGAFATVHSTTRPGRIRVYALAVTDGDATTGYVVTWAPLVHADAAADRFRAIIFGLAAAGVVAVWVAALLTSRLALAPVAQIIATARTIARQRAFAHRVPESGGDDELGKLGTTFNEMLEALEDAYRAQQRFVADAAHELRAPLTAIRGNIELLAHVKQMPDADRQEALAQLEQESVRLSRLVDELLTLASSDAGQRIERVDLQLDEVVLRAVADLMPTPSSARVEVGEIEALTIVGDRDRLHQLVTILVDNALKYTPEGEVRIELAASGRVAILRVVDTGIGVSADDLPHIFERFYRGEHARSRDPGGSGLGLPIAKWIAEQHGGRISVLSELGSGTTVTVELPLSSVAEAPIRAEPRRPIGSPRR